MKPGCKKTYTVKAGMKNLILFSTYAFSYDGSIENSLQSDKILFCTSPSPRRYYIGYIITYIFQAVGASMNPEFWVLCTKESLRSAFTTGFQSGITKKKCSPQTTPSGGHQTPNFSHFWHLTFQTLIFSSIQ